MKYLIKNCRLVDPANGIDDIQDILIADGLINKVGKDLNASAEEVIDAKGKIAVPGLIDMHVHLREPGREDKETVRTGTRAAIRGGFTSVLSMPNTEPPIDNPKTAKLLKEIIDKTALCNVFIAGAITQGREGKKLTDFNLMKKEGVIAVTDDGSSVEDDSVMVEALKKAATVSVIVIDHCEDKRLSAGGMINKGFISTKMGLRGISKEAEYAVVKRDIELASRLKARIHIAHVSCKESVDLIRNAKKDGILVTAETAPHYFTLTEECCVSYDTNTKMNPPLRTGDDVESVKNGLSDGTIDAIATDHAPHTDSEKGVEFDLAPFGIIGLETALSLAAMELIDTKRLSWADLVLKMSVNPAKILGLKRAGLKAGAAADITIIDPGKEYIYKKDGIESKSKNSPFVNWKLKAKVTDVFVGGRIVMKNEVILT
jgi:dihydroorotase